MADKHHDVIENAEVTELNADFIAIEHAPTIIDSNHEDNTAIDGAPEVLASEMNADTSDEDANASSEQGDSKNTREDTDMSENGEESERLRENTQQTGSPDDVQPQPAGSKEKKSSLAKKYISFSSGALIKLLRKPGNLSPRELDYIAGLLKIKASPVIHHVIEKKVRRSYGSGKKRYHPKNPTELLELLRYMPLPADLGKPKPQEEDNHRWAVVDSQTLPRMDTNKKETICPGLFMRLSDPSSKSRLDDDHHGFLSAAPALPLRTKKERQDFLRFHTYWRHRGLTQGISVTSHLSMLTSDHILPRFYGTRKKTEMICANLTLINGYAQIAAGFPILRVTDEMRHYEVISLYGDQEMYGISFFENEYLVPYCVVPDAIITTYKWRDIESWMKQSKCSYQDWYTTWAVPAYQAHEKARVEALVANPDMYEDVESIFVDDKTIDELEALFSAPIKSPRAPGESRRQSKAENFEVSDFDDNLDSNSMKRRWVLYGQSGDAAT
ncbi:putative cholesterol 7-alpha-monooxygenase protein [Botrytis fragariae]|uniref:Putative cholesterol 7-alpha-monooxygenase protein n=1 Tax=Botrytis fragariae TaxID=1964551 RepID=A0A8H6EDS6_9HELO|nr:putative cholesterol 7-alpha-monooxygenase protein [Botrytis fragariae]KAF5868592.1 putative cholesterol 7-alpha-monooxygenase protein [Botrytis fragariae]